jgi:RNA polymerase sigma factor (sigma-70 family)
MQFFRRQNSDRNLAPDAQPVTDWQLLEQFVEQCDQDAFESLMRIHGPMVLGVCRRVTGHHHDAEEAFQAAFLVLARKAASIWPRQMLASWLYGVAFRTALKQRTATAKRRAKEKQIEMLPEPVAPEERDWQEIAPLLDRELNRLPDTYRAAVICCDLQGCTRAEAARQLGWPEGTLKVRLMRARSLLSKRLTRHGVALSAGTLAVVLSQKAASAAVPAALLSSTAQAAGAVAATSGVSSAAGAKTAALVKGVAKSLFLGKTAVATVAAGVTVAAILAVTPSKKPAAKPPVAEPPAAITITSTTGLPAVVEQALQENARQLTPISVTCVAQMSSRLPMTETFDRLKLNQFSRSEHFFAADEARIFWQGNKIYSSVKASIGAAGDKEAFHQSDILYDGDSRIALMGSSNIQPEKFRDEQRKNGVNLPPVIRDLTKEPLATVIERLSSCCGATPMTYFQAPVGLVLAVTSGSGSAGIQQQQTLNPGSAILSGLSHGWKLISVGNTELEGRPVVRIDLDGENIIRANALAFDLEAHRRSLQEQRANFEKQLPRMNAQQKEMLLRSQEQQENQGRLMEALRKLPATRRYTFYLDPQLHYAVRRLDQSYGTDTLLSRADCTQFQQIPGRELWLPKKVETQLHEYYSAPGTFFKDAFLSFTTTVSSMSGDRIPPDVFKLDYESVPGTTVRDGTVQAKSSKSGDGYVMYTVPNRHEDLADVVARAASGQNMVRFPGGPPLAASPVAERFRSGALQTIVLCNAGLLGAVVAFVALRRRKNAMG